MNFNHVPPDSKPLAVGDVILGWNPANQVYLVFVVKHIDFNGKFECSTAVTQAEAEMLPLETMHIDGKVAFRLKR